jgi:hypothetical protein
MLAAVNDGRFATRTMERRWMSLCGLPGKGHPHRGPHLRIQEPEFLPTCGSSLFGRKGDEIEIHGGCLDAPNQLKPTYENWIIGREGWLPLFELARRYQRDLQGNRRTEP